MRAKGVGRARGLLLLLQQFPIAQYLGRVAHLPIPPDVRVAALELGLDTHDDVAQRKIPRLGGHLGLHDDVVEQVTQLLAQVGGVVGVQRCQHLVSLLQQSRAHALWRLLLIPRAATGAAQDSHRLGQRGQPGFGRQRGEVEGRQVVDVRVAVDLMQRHPFNCLIFFSGSMNEGDKLLSRVYAHQGQLQLTGQQTAVHLAQQHRHVGIERRVEGCGNVDGVKQLQPVQGVYPQGGQRRLDEAQSGDQAHGQPTLGRAAPDGGHGRFADKRVAGHGIEHIPRAP